MIDEKALAAAIEATRRAGQRGDLTSSPVSRVVMEAAILAYESAKPKEAGVLAELAAACPTIVKAGAKLTTNRVTGKVVVGGYGDVPAVEFKRLAAILAYGSAKQKETDGLKLGSRLTVAGVEAVVAPVVDLQPIAEVADHYDGMFVEPDVPILAVGTARFRLNNARSIRAMLSAAGDKE